VAQRVAACEPERARCTRPPHRLEYCDLGDRAAKAIAAWLSRPDGCQLTTLNLSHNLLRDDGLAVLAGSLEHIALQSLDLSFNGVQRLDPLAHALQTN
jgi:hypothetical protein